MKTGLEQGFKLYLHFPRLTCETTIPRLEVSPSGVHGVCGRAEITFWNGAGRLPTPSQGPRRAREPDQLRKDGRSSCTRNSVEAIQITQTWSGVRYGVSKGFVTLQSPRMHGCSTAIRPRKPRPAAQVVSLKIGIHHPVPSKVPLMGWTGRDFTTSMRQASRQSMHTRYPAKQQGSSPRPRRQAASVEATRLSSLSWPSGLPRTEALPAFRSARAIQMPMGLRSVSQVLRQKAETGQHGAAMHWQW